MALSLRSVFAGLTGLFMAGALAAQEVPSETPPPAPVPTETLAPTPPPSETPAPTPAQTPAPSGPARVAPLPPAPPTPPLEQENVWNLDLSSGGRVSIQLRPDVAPGHVERIKTLTRRGFYNGLVFHRVIEGFMAQGGDPTGTGTGDSDLPNLNAEFSNLPHVRGALGMARTQDPNSANSQFYIMFVPRLNMDRNYTVLGRVVSGMNFVDALERGEPPLAPSRIVRASIGSDNVPPLSAEQLRTESERLAAAAAPQAAPPAAPGTPVVLVPENPAAQPPR